MWQRWCEALMVAVVRGGAGGGASVVELGGSGRSVGRAVTLATQHLFGRFFCLSCLVMVQSNCYKLVLRGS